MIILLDVMLMLYLLILFLFMNSNSNFMFWILLECNMMSFICLMFFSNEYSSKMECYDLSLFFFFIQSLSSIIFLVSSSFSCFFFMEGSFILILFSLFLKSGLFPLFFWVYDSVSSFSSFSLWLMLGVQKVPLYLFLFSLNSFYLVLFLLMSMVSGSFKIYSSSSWSEVLLSSSIYSSFWIFFTFLLGAFNFFIYFFLYISFTFFFSKFLNIKNFLMVMDFLFLCFLFVSFMGLPPFSIFFFKLYFINSVLISLNFFTFTLVWFSVFFSLFGYYKVFYKGLLTFNFNYFYKTSLLDTNYYFSLFFLLVSPIFLMSVAFSSNLWCKMLSSYLK